MEIFKKKYGIVLAQLNNTNTSSSQVASTFNTTSTTSTTIFTPVKINDEIININSTATTSNAFIYEGNRSSNNDENAINNNNNNLLGKQKLHAIIFLFNTLVYYHLIT